MRAQARPTTQIFVSITRSDGTVEDLGLISSTTPKRFARLRAILTLKRSST